MLDQPRIYHSRKEILDNAHHCSDPKRMNKDVAPNKADQPRTRWCAKGIGSPPTEQEASRRWINVNGFASEGDAEDGTRGCAKVRRAPLVIGVSFTARPENHGKLAANR